MKLRKKVVGTVFGIAILALVLLGLFGCWYKVRYGAFAEGAMQTQVNEMFFQVALLKKMQNVSSEKELEGARQYLREHMKLNWRSLQSSRESMNMDITGVKTLNKYITEVLGKRENPGKQSELMK